MRNEFVADFAENRFNNKYKGPHENIPFLTNLRKKFERWGILKPFIVDDDTGKMNMENSLGADLHNLVVHMKKEDFIARHSPPKVNEDGQVLLGANGKPILDTDVGTKVYESHLIDCPSRRFYVKKKKK